MRAIKGLCLGLGVITVVLAGCVKMAPQEWTPTKGLAADQQGPNFLICRSCADSNYNGQLEPGEIEGVNPDQMGSGEEVNFVVRNTSSWKLKAQVELHDKENGKLIFRSPVGAIPAGQTWITSTKLPEYEQASQVEAEFYVDFARAQKAVFTVVP